jgi:hypothetical protein
MSPEYMHHYKDTDVTLPPDLVYQSETTDSWPCAGKIDKGGGGPVHLRTTIKKIQSKASSSQRVIRLLFLLY